MDCFKSDICVFLLFISSCITFKPLHKLPSHYTKHFYKTLLFFPIPAGKVFSPAKKTSHSGNPWVSVLISWFCVQVGVDALNKEKNSDPHRKT